MKYDILLIGGNGFVGSVLAAKLQMVGYSVLLPTSHLAAARNLRVLPKVHLEDVDVHEFDGLQNLCARVKSNGAVINLVGVLHDKPAQPYGKIFKAAHVDLPKNIMTAMKMHGLKRYLHMSALGADVNGPSMYQRSKGAGEHEVKASGLDWTIFRPYLKTFNNKGLEILHGPATSMNELAKKRIKRKSITLVKRML